MVTLPIDDGLILLSKDSMRFLRNFSKFFKFCYSPLKSSLNKNVQLGAVNFLRTMDSKIYAKPA
jgi:hypothetical protein